MKSTAATGVLIEELRKSSTCSICLRYYAAPVTLGCGHTYCRTCIDESLQSGRSTCPICSIKIQRRNIVEQADMSSLIESISNFANAYEKENGFRPVPPGRIGNRITVNNSVNHNHVSFAGITQSIGSRKDSECDRTVSRSDGESLDIRSTENVLTEGGKNLCSGDETKEKRRTLQLRFDVGTVVNVADRSWIGVNKPGGVARILSVADTDGLSDDPSNNNYESYSVKYVLTGCIEHNVCGIFIRPYTQLSRSSRQRVQLTGTTETADRNLERVTENSSQTITKHESGGKRIQHKATKSSKKRQFSGANSNSTSNTSESVAQHGSSLMDSTCTTSCTISRRRKVSISDYIVPIAPEINVTGTCSATGRGECDSSTGANINETRPSRNHPQQSCHLPVQTVEIVVLSSILQPEQQILLQKFAEMFHDRNKTTTSSNGQNKLKNQKKGDFSAAITGSNSLRRSVSVAVVTAFSERVTHLVVPVDKHGVLKQRTMKYMQAIINGVWIVSTDWVVQCLKQQKLLAEDSFEVAKNAKASELFAPRRARELKEQSVMMSSSSSLSPPATGKTRHIGNTSDYAYIATATSTSSNCNNGSCVSSRNRSNVADHGGDDRENSKFTMNLFSSYQVILYGQFPSPGPPRSEVEYLLKKGGATIINLPVSSCSQQKLDGGMSVPSAGPPRHRSSSSSSSSSQIHQPQQQGHQKLASLLEATSTSIGTTGTDSGSGGGSGSSSAAAFGRATNGAEEIQKCVVVVCNSRDYGQEFLREYSFDCRNCTIVSTLWVLDSVANFKLMLLSNYSHC